MQKVEIWTFTIELAFSLSAMLIESQEYYHGYLKSAVLRIKNAGSSYYNGGRLMNFLLTLHRAQMEKITLAQTAQFFYLRVKL